MKFEVEVVASSDPAPSCATWHTRGNALEVAVTEKQPVSRGANGGGGFFRLSGGRMERSHLPPAGSARRAEEIIAALLPLPLPLRVFYGREELSGGAAMCCFA